MSRTAVISLVPKVQLKKELPTLVRVANGKGFWRGLRFGRVGLNIGGINPQVRLHGADGQIELVGDFGDGETL